MKIHVITNTPEKINKDLEKFENQKFISEPVVSTSIDKDGKLLITVVLFTR